MENVNYNKWLETNGNEIERSLQIACIDWINGQSASLGHDEIDCLQLTEAGRFAPIPINGSKFKSKCGYAASKIGDLFFVVTFNSFYGEKNSFNTGKTLKELWNSRSPIISRQCLIKPANINTATTSHVEAESLLKSDLELFNRLHRLGSSRYLNKKCLLGIKSECLRYGKNFIALLIQDVFNGNARGIQKIYDDGAKFFTKGMKKQAGHILIDGQDSIVICEGFSTGMSLHLATNATVYCALDAGNLKTIALALKEKLTREQVKLPVMIAADNDIRLPSDINQQNIGMIKAHEASKITGFKLIYPTLLSNAGRFPNVFQHLKCDFNDVHIELGLAMVHEQFLMLS